jgi:hypothetical protein
MAIVAVGGIFTVNPARHRLDSPWLRRYGPARLQPPSENLT